jgi:hypothetical protein
MAWATMLFPGTAFMKFIKLDSRGGNYLVVASNIAWLRAAENGQTSVGMVGGQPLLVVGSIEDVAGFILAGMAELAGDAGDHEAAVASATVALALPAPELEAAPEPFVAASDFLEPALPPQAALKPDAAPAPAPAPTSPYQASARTASMWELPASDSAKDVKMMNGSQRMMGTLE